MSTQIKLENVSKCFNKNTLFTDLNYTFKGGNIYGVSGANGSGKSTLLKIISGLLEPDSGTLNWQVNTQAIAVTDVYKQVRFYAPYVDVFDSFSILQTLDIHFQAHTMYVSKAELLDHIGFSDIKNEPIHTLSTGMYQKLLLGLTLYTQKPILILDEPTSNLDTANQNWVFSFLKNPKPGQIMIIGSNEQRELNLCQDILSLPIR